MLCCCFFKLKTLQFFVGKDPRFEMFGGGSCSALDGLKCGLSSAPVSPRMGYTPNLSTPNFVSCLLYIGFLAISACFFLSSNHIGDFTISVSHFNAYLVLEFLSHEGILDF